MSREHEADSAHLLREWITEQVTALRPLGVPEVEVEHRGSRPAYPTTSGPGAGEPIDPPPPRHYIHRVAFRFNAGAAGTLPERLTDTLIESAMADRSLGGRFDRDARVEPDEDEPRVEKDGKLILQFRVSVGYPPRPRSA